MILIWVETVLIALFSGALIESIGIGQTFLIYGIITGCCLVYLFLNMKETKGLTRKQIIEKFQDGNSLTGDEEEKQKLTA